MEDGFKYDVGISFLVQDISLAAALSDKLSESLGVFFFPRNQEELAGTDGLESMRRTFLQESRLNVVVYRQRWGSTPWTGVEEAAIRDSCLKCSFKNVFFFMVEPKDTKPDWLPDTPIRFNYGEFTLEQAIGAIKLRVKERGGRFEPLTPIKRAEQLKTEERYQRAKSAMNSQDGLEKIALEVDGIIAEMERQIAEINAGGGTTIECEATRFSACVLRHDRVGMITRWHQRYSNSLDNSGLTVEEYNGRLLFQGELGRFMQPVPPECIKTVIYEPDLSPAYEYGWKVSKGAKGFIPTRDLAEKCLLQFMDLIQRDMDGKLSRKSPNRNRSNIRGGSGWA
jgi:hypothetical protein